MKVQEWYEGQFIADIASFQKSKYYVKKTIDAITEWYYLGCMVRLLIVFENIEMGVRH